MRPSSSAAPTSRSRRIGGSGRTCWARSSGSRSPTLPPRVAWPPLTDRTGAVSTSQLLRPIDDPGDPGSYPPVVSVSASPTAGAAPLTVQFYSYAYDPDGWVTDYYWDFGDGGWAYDSAPIHTYTSPGVYTAWLTVTDD